MDNSAWRLPEVPWEWRTHFRWEAVKQTPNGAKVILDIHLESPDVDAYTSSVRAVILNPALRPAIRAVDFHRSSFTDSGEADKLSAEAWAEQHAQFAPDCLRKLVEEDEV